MTNPKISVGADVSGVVKAIADVQKQIQDMNKNLASGEVGLDVKQVKADLAALNKLAEDLKDNFQAAAKSGSSLSSGVFEEINDVMKEAVDTASQYELVLDAIGQSSGLSRQVKATAAITDNLNRARKTQEALGKEGIKVSNDQAEAIRKNFDRLRASGARGTSKLRNVELDEYLTGGWRNYSINENEARRQRARVMRSVGIDVPEEEASGKKARKGWGGLKDAMSQRGGRAGTMAGAAGGMVGGMLQGGDGGMFSALGGGGGALIGGAAGFAFGGPVGAVVGAGAAQLLGGLGSTIDAAVNRVIEQNSGLTDLRHSLGATTTDFDLLRGSVMHFTDNLGVTGQESVKLARTFAEAAGKTLDAVDLGRATGNAVGFARGYGMDPNVAAQFFGAMRHFGITKDSGSDKRLALMVGEAVARNGMTPKMGEVMGALQNYVETQTRSSLTSANANAYTSFMTSMTGLSLAGMKGDPTTAMSAMGAADSALRRGGAFGEASRMFSLSMLQRMLPGFNALGMGWVQDQGAFGTLGRAFGEDSPAMAMAMATGDKRSAAQYRKWASGKFADQTILSLQMREVERLYGGSGADGMSEAIQNHFGLSSRGQASALYNAFKNEKGMGGLQSRLSGLGIDIGGLDTQQIAALAQVDQMSGAEVNAEANRLLGSDILGKEDKDALRKAVAQGDEEAKKTLLQLTALNKTTDDNGQVMRRQQADMVNSLDKLAEQMLPMVSSIKDAIIEMVRVIAPDSGVAESIAAREEGALAAQIDQTLETQRARIRGMKDGPEKDAAIQDYNALLGSRQGMKYAPSSGLPFLDKSGKPMAGGGGSLDPEIVDYFLKKGYSLQHARGIAAGIYAESGNNPFIENPDTKAFGLGQWLGPRKMGLMAKYGQRPTKQQQLDYLHYELQGGDHGGAAVLAAQGEFAVLDRYVKKFMRPAKGGETSGDIRRGRAALAGSDAGRAPIPFAAPSPSADMWPGGALDLGGGKGLFLTPEARAKLPKEHKKISALDGSHQVIEHRVTVLDSGGSPHYNSVTQTRVGHPVPAGMAMG